MFLWPFLASDLNFRAIKYLVVLDLKQVLFIICFNRNFKIVKKIFSGFKRRFDPIKYAKLGVWSPVV